jgi:hypothetical protein
MKGRTIILTLYLCLFVLISHNNQMVSLESLAPYIYAFDLQIGFLTNQIRAE